MRDNINDDGYNDVMLLMDFAHLQRCCCAVTAFVVPTQPYHHLQSVDWHGTLCMEPYVIAPRVPCDWPCQRSIRIRRRSNFICVSSLRWRCRI